jgi:hypothetical protein
MADFIKWCEKKELTLPPFAENVHRSGIRPAYPDAYSGRGYAYPPQYFGPTSATAYLDQKNAGSLKGKK